MNKLIKFSLGHIFATVALFVISYLCFSGVTYTKNYNLFEASIFAGAIFVILLVFFIVPQILKSTSRRFNKRLRIERILLCCAPVVLFFALRPAVHFIKISMSNKDRVEKQLTETINSSTEIFDKYEQYSNNRIAHYTKTLQSAGRDKILIENRTSALRLQLLGGNYTALKNAASSQIAEFLKEQSALNIMMLRNIADMEKTITQWRRDYLIKYSAKIHSDEPATAVHFDSNSAVLDEIEADFRDLRKLYTTSSDTGSGVFLFVYVLSFLFLILPYLMQERHSKSTCRLFGVFEQRNNGSNGNGSFDL